MPFAVVSRPGEDAPMDIADTQYVVTPDGVYIAYQVYGDGPIDVVWQTDWPGNIDMEVEDPLGRLWTEELSSFARVIAHDRRGIGLSSRNVALPNLETRVSDLLAVMDAVGAERPILTGIFESGAPNALLAASKPERVHSMVWMEPSPRFAWAPDYPWGRKPQEMEAELDLIGLWGTRAYARAFLEDEAERGNVLPDNVLSLMAKASRNACTPDVARALARIWYESDVRGVLPSVQVPTLILTMEPDDLDKPSYVASLIPGAEVRAVSGGVWSEESIHGWVDEIRRVAGVPALAADLDRVLAAVLFTDVVGSTERLAEVGDAEWRSILARHDERGRAEIERHRGRYIDSAGDGLFATFDGPARAVRCAQAIGASVRELGLDIRAGVHTGEVEMDGSGVRGIAVHIGARIAAFGGPSEVWVSQTVKDLTAGSGLRFEDRGEHDLKGVPERWHLYTVV
jgi:class 3 adenylate cyclase